MRKLRGIGEDHHKNMKYMQLDLPVKKMNNPEQKIWTLHDLLDYDASKFSVVEIQLKNQLASWIQIAQSLKLKAILQKYQDFTKAHVSKLEVFFKDEKFISLGAKHQIIQAFIRETDEKLSLCGDGEVKDACLVSCIQEINHFKISSYGTAAAFANALGMSKYAELFHEAEVNEKQIDDRLTQLAEFEINIRAKSPSILTH